ncbi:hypothetical protein [Halalkalirubrum salinum]|uniref:hypothetical protein n=1 Tax=Halalkalirubrum salinum TaxID=2563889 RepID=UPI0010FBA3E9|nr:hypothetical protein [Halalkalirubrum salinum]
MSLFTQIRQPEYTGENRCIPCTIVNVALTAIGAIALFFVSVPLAIAFTLVGLGSIWLRGYLVPGTPELTKRYFPDWLLARFDKLPADGSPVDQPDIDTIDDTVPDEADLVDPVETLLSAGVIEPCDDDVCLTASFADRWRAALDELEADRDAQAAAIHSLRGLPSAQSVTLETDQFDRHVASADGDRIARWTSEGALLADLAAHEVLSSSTDMWMDIVPVQRFAILEAFRSFLDRCPVCGGEVAMTEETVKSCCRSWDVIAVVCADCEERFLEVDPDAIEAAAVA